MMFYHHELQEDDNDYIWDHDEIDPRTVPEKNGINK